MDKHTEQGMILVAPTALPSTTSCIRRWRSLTGSTGPNAIPDWADFATNNSCTAPAVSINGHDLFFIEQLIQELDNSFNIDQRFAFGFSNGAGMVMQLMISNWKQFTAVDPETRSPAMLIWGTGDKTQMPAARLIAAANYLEAAGAPNCTAPLNTPELVFQCLMSNPMGPALNRHTYISRIEETQDWLVDFNNAVKRPVEGLYPDLGHGQVNGPEDDTMTVRRDFQAGKKGQAVSVLTIIDGRHVFPGPTGNEPPCANASCDIDAMEEILHFWRANSGLNNLWQ